MYSRVKENVQGHFDFHFLCFEFNYFSNKRYSVFTECTANYFIEVQLKYKLSLPGVSRLLVDINSEFSCTK